MDWFFVTLLSAFLLATADALTKRFHAGYPSHELTLLRILLPALPMVPLLFFFPLGAVQSGFWWLVLVLIPLEALATFLYMAAIRSSPLHLTVPYMAFTPVLNIFTGWFFLDEMVSMQGVGGITLVVLGAYLLNFRYEHLHSARALLEPLTAIIREPGSRLMLMAATIYSLVSVLGKKAFAYTDPVTFALYYYVILAACYVAYYSWRRPAALVLVIRRPVSNAIIGLLLAVMIVSHFIALAQVEVAYMIAVKRSSLLFGILYGAFMFKEAGLGLHFLAGSVMVAGIVLIVM